MSGDIGDFRGLLAKVGNGEALSIDEAERAFDIMTNGDATPAQMGAFLMGLKVRGETAAELAGGARVLRATVQRVKAPDGAIDIVGTGGDHHGSARGCRGPSAPARLTFCRESSPAAATAGPRPVSRPVRIRRRR